MEILEKIGLTKKEAEVYETLLRLGNSPIASVLKETGSHPQVVYRAIDSLKKQGLVVESRRRHRKYIRAEDPRKLIKLEKEKLAELETTVKKLNELRAPTKGAVVRVSHGDEAIRDLRLRGVEELKASDTYYVIGASSDRYYEIMGDTHKEFRRKREKKRIRWKVIGYEDQREVLDKERAGKNTQIRYLPVQFPVFSSTNVFNDTVAILIWSDEPIAIVIESAEVAESYKQYFNTLWRFASE